MDERYEIRIRGYLGPLLRTAIGKLRYRTLPNQSTIRGRLSDAEVELLLERLNRSGVELVCLSRVPPDSPAVDGVAGISRPQDRNRSRPTRREP
jgi:hypothetical protein